MFTGIIQGQGKITSLRKNGAECRLAIHPLFTLADVTDGESIAVNGACLSVESHSRDGFTAYASAETLTRTTLDTLSNGDLVNLERALALGDRLGGHLVSGHVDCLATVREVRPAGPRRTGLLCVSYSKCVPPGNPFAAVWNSRPLSAPKSLPKARWPLTESV